MKEINVTELKKIQLNILDAVNLFCTEKKIKYWLDYGTLLGSIRHKGYIPWDDDIDIGMLRDDFDHFIHSFNETNNRYKVSCNELQNNSMFAFAKVLDTTTVLYEPDKNGIKSSVNIDVFVYDVTPGGAKSVLQHIKASAFYRLNLIQFNWYRFSSCSKRCVVAFLQLFTNIFPKGYFAKKIVKNSKKYSKMAYEYIGLFTCCEKIISPKNVFDKISQGSFEGKLYPIPEKYDEWLTTVYGKYMELPPTDKRKSHHYFKAYISD